MAHHHHYINHDPLAPVVTPDPAVTIPTSLAAAAPAAAATTVAAHDVAAAVGKHHSPGVDMSHFRHMWA